MKETAILAALIFVTIYATFADGAIRKVCPVKLDNGTKVYLRCK